MRSLLRAVSVLAVLVLNSSFYWPKLPKTGQEIGATIPHLDKLVHVAIFALTTALVLHLLVPTRPRSAARISSDVPRPRAAGWAVAAIGAHAFIIEAVQHWLTPTRTGDVADIVADLAGMAIALGGWAARRRVGGGRAGGGRTGHAGRERTACTSGEKSAVSAQKSGDEAV